MIINHQVHPIKRYSIFEWIWMQKKKLLSIYVGNMYQATLSGAEVVRFLGRFLSLHSLPRRH